MTLFTCSLFLEEGDELNGTVSGTLYVSRLGTQSA